MKIQIEIKKSVLEGSKKNQKPREEYMYKYLGFERRVLVNGDERKDKWKECFDRIGLGSIVRNMYWGVKSIKMQAK